jgi:hypothetical protein
MSAGNPEGDMPCETGQFVAVSDNNFTKVTETTSYENGWTPIRQDEFERLPDWCIELYKERMKGVLPVANNDEVSAALHSYLHEPKWVSELTQEETKVDTCTVEPTNDVMTDEN